MSLEDALAKLTSAVEKNTAALLGKAAPAAGKAAEKTETAEAPAEEKRGRGRPAGSGKKGPTLEVVTEKANAYMEQEGKPAARALLKKHGSPDGKLAGVPKENYAALVKEIDEAMADDGDDDGDDGDDDDSI